MLSIIINITMYHLLFIIMNMEEVLPGKLVCADVPLPTLLTGITVTVYSIHAS